MTVAFGYKEGTGELDRAFGVEGPTGEKWREKTMVNMINYSESCHEKEENSWRGTWCHDDRNGPE